jgi:hypothetical protein
MHAPGVFPLLQPSYFYLFLFFLFEAENFFAIEKESWMGGGIGLKIANWKFRSSVSESDKA